jgi:hypothetical protein
MLHESDAICIKQGRIICFAVIISISSEAAMPTALPVRNVAHPIPELSPARIANLQCPIAGGVVRALAITLSVHLPIGANKSDWDVGSYIASFDH